MDQTVTSQLIANYLASRDCEYDRDCLRPRNDGILQYGLLGQSIVQRLPSDIELCTTFLSIPCLDDTQSARPGSISTVICSFLPIRDLASHPQGSIQPLKPIRLRSQLEDQSVILDWSKDTNNKF